MKHIKCFERYISKEENSMDNILDKISDYGMKSLNDEELEILRNQGKIKEHPKSELTKLQKSLSPLINTFGKDSFNYKEYDRLFPDLGKYPGEHIITADELKKAIGKIKAFRPNFYILSILVGAHPEIKTDKKLKKIYDEEFGTWWSKQDKSSFFDVESDEEYD